MTDPEKDHDRRGGGEATWTGPVGLCTLIGPGGHPFWERSQGEASEEAES